MSLIEDIPFYQVTFDLRNGKELIDVLHQKKNIPDIILLDINMPIMNGFETMEWLRTHYPDIPVLALTINDDDESVLRMLRLGVKGYLLKDTDSDELLLAMQTILKKGFFHTDIVNKNLLKSVTHEDSIQKLNIELKERELEFLNLASTDLNYNQIAEKMFLSPRSIDHYRESLFEKFQVKSRVGMIVYAIKYNIIKI